MFGGMFPRLWDVIVIILIVCGAWTLRNSAVLLQTWWVNMTTSCSRGLMVTVADTCTSPGYPRRCKILIKTDEAQAQLYQNHFNFTGPLVITHERHENNSQPWPGVNTTADVPKYLRLFFPAITDDAINSLLELYQESQYSSPGLQLADMKQSFDMTAHDYALTRAWGNETWNAMVESGEATHGTDQSYYCMPCSFRYWVRLLMQNRVQHLQSFG